MMAISVQAVAEVEVVGAGTCNAAEVIGDLKDYFALGISRPLEWRREQLIQFEKLLLENEDVLAKALYLDLHKAPQEVLTTEIGILLSEIKVAQKNLKNWSKKRKVSTPLTVYPARSYMQPEPLGVVLIMGAWNYPLQLTLLPMVSAIAAGNMAVIKPPEMAVHTSKIIADLLPKYLDKRAIRVIEGGAEVATELLAERWDHIFYTGGARVGRIVMSAAANHLTPVTLELGGKSPCIVTQDADMELAAKRIAWGKFLNAGQTCIAPDYLLCTQAVSDQLLPLIKHHIDLLYSEKNTAISDYGRIINQQHTKRLAAYMSDGDIYCGGDVDVANKYISPTILTHVKRSSPVMQEEIFGPVLPVMIIEDESKVEAFILEGEKPLALYVFSGDKKYIEDILLKCSSGSACVNDCMVFALVDALPFGGVGNSGMGAYHGIHGFNTYSHLKAVLQRSGFMNSLDSLRSAPYSKKKMAIFRKLI